MTEEIKEEKDIKYYKEWIKQDFASSGIGLGNLTMDQEIVLFLQFLKEIYSFSLHRGNTKLSEKIQIDKDKIINLLEKRVNIDKELGETLPGIVDYYMKL